MTLALRIAAIVLVLAALWPEVMRYRAEHLLERASTRIEHVFRTRANDAQARAVVALAGDEAARAAGALPNDNRAALLHGIALILQSRAAEAVAVFDAAIAAGERPELTLNLGRARSALGDEPGADTAFLRTAWASAFAINSLPAAERASILARVAALEAELRAGRLTAVPPLQQSVSR